VFYKIVLRQGEGMKQYSLSLKIHIFLRVSVFFCLFKVVSWPSASGLNESDAMKMCRDFLLSVNVGSVCSHLPDIGFELAIHSCVTDMGVRIRNK
jgi:hypothetical protein